MSKLWVRHAVLLIVISVTSVAIAAIGFVVFGWADQTFVSDTLPHEVEARLTALENAAAPIQAEISAILDTWFTPEDRARRTALMASIVGVCCVINICFAVVTSRWITQPISAAANQLQNLASGDLQGRISSHSSRIYGAEIAQLLHDVDKLAATLGEREARIRKDTAIIAHELRTPLTTMTSHLHAIRDGVIPTGADEVDILLRGTERLGKMIEDLRTLSLANAGQLQLAKTQLYLGEVVANAVRDLEPQFEAAGISVNTGLETVAYFGDGPRLLQAVQCILANVLSHATGGTAVDISVGRSTNTATIVIADDGPGFVKSLDTELLFSPFYKGNNSERGSGLGLTIANAIVRMHGGTLIAKSGTNGGAAFEVKLPE